MQNAIVLHTCVPFEPPHEKTTICRGENKDADQLRGNREADHAFVFATRIVQFLFYLNPKFQASSFFLLLGRPVCVRSVRKPHCWFSHETAHLFYASKKMLDHYNSNAQSFEPPCGKSNNEVFAQVRHKPSCTSTEKCYMLEILDISRKRIVLSV